MVIDAPASMQDLAEALSISVEQVGLVLENLRDEYDREQRGFELRESQAGGGFIHGHSTIPLFPALLLAATRKG